MSFVAIDSIFWVYMYQPARQNCLRINISWQSFACWEKKRQIWFCEPTQGSGLRGGPLHETTQVWIIIVTVIILIIVIVIIIVTIINVNIIAIVMMVLAAGLDEPYSGHLPWYEEWVHWQWGGRGAWGGEKLTTQQWADDMIQHGDEQVIWWQNDSEIFKRSRRQEWSRWKGVVVEKLKWKAGCRGPEAPRLLVYIYSNK